MNTSGGALSNNFCNHVLIFKMDGFLRAFKLDSLTKKLLCATAISLVSYGGYKIWCYTKSAAIAIPSPLETLDTETSEEINISPRF